MQIPDNLSAEEILSFLQNLETPDFLNLSYIKYIGLVCAVLLALSLAGRTVFKTRSIFRSTVGTMAAVLAMYVVHIAVSLLNLKVSLPVLPFAQILEDRLYILPITKLSLSTVCLEFLHLMVLALFIAILDEVLPKTKNFFLWVLRSLLLLVLSFGAQAVICYGFVTFFPASWVAWTPVILVGLTVLVMFMGLLKLVLGLILTAVNPILAGVYAFLFMNKVGKKLSTAFFSTVLFGALLYLADYFGFTVISLAGLTILPCLPFAALFLLFWYIV